MLTNILVTSIFFFQNTHTSPVGAQPLPFPHFFFFLASHQHTHTLVKEKRKNFSKSHFLSSDSWGMHVDKIKNKKQHPAFLSVWKPNRCACVCVCVATKQKKKQKANWFLNGKYNQAWCHCVFGHRDFIRYQYIFKNSNSPGSRRIIKKTILFGEHREDVWKLKINFFFSKSHSGGWALFDYFILCYTVLDPFQIPRQSSCLFSFFPQTYQPASVISL